MRRVKFTPPTEDMTWSECNVLFRAGDVRDLPKHFAMKLVEDNPHLFKIVKSEKSAKPAANKMMTPDSDKGGEPADDGDPRIKAAYTRAKEKLAEGKGLTEFEQDAVKQIDGE